MTGDSGVGQSIEERVVGIAGSPPGQGPFMRLFLFVQGGIVREASYDTYLCPAAHECGKAVCELVRGKGVEEARQVDHEAVASRVGPLPRPKMFCYGLAVLALANALGQLRNAVGWEKTPT